MWSTWNVRSAMARPVCLPLDWNVILEGTGSVKRFLGSVLGFFVPAGARRDAGGVKVERPQRSEDE
jgi:hypothetical protein